MRKSLNQAYLIGSLAVILATLPALMLAGCSQTVESTPPVVTEMQKGEAPAAVTGFFGNDYSKLTPGTKGQAAMVYINPDAQWSKYDKIMLEPIEFWDSANSGVSPEDQHTLTAYFHNKLKEDLEKHFKLVDQGGPGVLVLQGAMVNATAATPGLRSVSVIIPQARILNAVQSLGTGSYAFVGSAEAEMKVSDSETGELLAAAIDKRSGGMALSSAAQWKWGDAENAMDYWSKKITDRLLELQGKTTASK